jgi:hypothetical protein
MATIVKKKMALINSLSSFLLRVFRECPLCIVDWFKVLPTKY